MENPKFLIESLDTALAEYSPGIDRAVRFVSIDQVDMLAEFYLNARKTNPVSQWQPIETAPKGVEILTMRSNGYTRNAFWYDNPFGRKDSVIDNVDGSWWTVTHWMPLPLSPQK